MLLALKVRRLPLKFEIEQRNRHKISEMNKWNVYNIAKVIKLAPENKLTILLAEAINKNVHELKTDDIDLLNLNDILIKTFNLRVVKCELK